MKVKQESTSRKFSVSVVIPNYNGVELLRVNLPFVYKALEAAELSTCDIIVADDASKDDSISFLKKNYPQIKLVENKLNKGFGANVNSGVAVSTSDLILLLNSDVQLSPDYFKHLIPFFYNDDCFGVMGKIISMDGMKIQDAAKFPDYSFANIHSNLNYSIDSAPYCYTFFLSGANSLIDRSKFKLLGGFQDVFNPYYSEDVDLSLSAWQAGYTLYYEHKAICKHPNSATIKKENGKKVALISKRNKLVLHYLHLNGIELFYFNVISVLKAIINLIIVNTLYSKALLLYVRMLPKLKHTKAKLAPYRIFKLKEISNLIKNKISENQTGIKKF